MESPAWLATGRGLKWGRRAPTWQASALRDHSSIGNLSPCGELSWGAVPCHFGTRIIEAPRPQPIPRLGPFPWGDGHSWKRLRVRCGVLPKPQSPPRISEADKNDRKCSTCWSRPNERGRQPEAPHRSSNALRQSSKCRTRGEGTGCSLESRTRSRSPTSARIAVLSAELRLGAFRMDRPFT